MVGSVQELYNLIKNHKNSCGKFLSLLTIKIIDFYANSLAFILCPYNFKERHEAFKVLRKVSFITVLLG